jgi:transcriptional regulator with XRE-family HTH domain
MKLDYAEIGHNIRRYRINSGLKQKTLAEKIHVSSQHISHIENGHAQLSLPTLVAIANELSVDCNTLLGNTLTGSQQTILHQEIGDLLNQLNSQQLRLYIEIGRILIEYG